MAAEHVLVLPASHAALHLWIESEEIEFGFPGGPGWSADYLNVSLTDEVLAWCDTFLSARPAVAPGRYPNEEFPDCAMITRPLYHMLPNDCARVHFATENDAIHFRLAWY